MLSDVFDKYDIRVRLCSCIFIMSPAIIDAYILFDGLKSISATFIVIAVILAMSCYLSVYIRFYGNKIKNEDLVSIYLSPNSEFYTQIEKQRFYRKIAEKEETLKDLQNYKDLPEDKIRQLCISAASWLRSITRDEKFRLVKEENMNYGFIRSLYSYKKPFFVQFSIYSIVMLVYFIYINPNDLLKNLTSINSLMKNIPANLILICMTHLLAYAIWIFGITKTILTFASDKYARAVIGSIDNL